MAGNGDKVGTGSSVRVILPGMCHSGWSGTDNVAGCTYGASNVAIRTCLRGKVRLTSALETCKVGAVSSGKLESSGYRALSWGGNSGNP